MISGENEILRAITVLHKEEGTTTRVARYC